MKTNKSDMYIKVHSKWVTTPAIDIIKNRKIELGSKNHRRNFSYLDPKILDRLVKAISLEVGFQNCKLVVENYE